MRRVEDMAPVADVHGKPVALTGRGPSRFERCEGLPDTRLGKMTILAPRLKQRRAWRNQRCEIGKVQLVQPERDAACRTPTGRAECCYRVRAAPAASTSSWRRPSPQSLQPALPSAMREIRRRRSQRPRRGLRQPADEPSNRLRGLHILSRDDCGERCADLHQIRGKRLLGGITIALPAAPANCIGAHHAIAPPDEFGAE